MSAEERIERAVEALVARLDGVPTEALYREPSAGEWPVMSTLAHVVELLPYWASQCQTIARSPGVAFGRTLDDPGRLGAIAAHAQDPAEVVRGSLRSSCAEAISIMRTLPAAQWQLAGQHVRRGAMSIEQVVDEFMVAHVEDHVQQVDAALAALGYSPSQVP